MFRYLKSFITFGGMIFSGLMIELSMILFRVHKSQVELLHINIHMYKWVASVWHGSLSEVSYLDMAR